MSIFLPPGVEEQMGKEANGYHQDPPPPPQEPEGNDRQDDLPDHIKTITILWDSEKCVAAIKHDPQEWGCWAGIAGVLEAAATTAKLNHHLMTMMRIQQEQQQAMAQQQMAQQIGQQIRHRPLPPGRRGK